MNQATLKSICSSLSQITRSAGKTSAEVSRASIRETVVLGNKVTRPNADLFIPKGVLEAPRAGFNETTQAYVDLIKNNRQELECMTRRYLSNSAATEEQFAEEFMSFLKTKTNMPYTPEVKIFSSETLAGGMDNVNGILYYNTRHMTRLSELPATLMHETHHFLQQKEIFSIMSIEEFSMLKARKDILQLAAENPTRYATRSDMTKAIHEQADAYVKEFKEAGWEEVMKCYPKNTNPASASYKRAKQLADADLAYEGSGRGYFNNLQEREAFDISTRTQLEFEHSILGEITAYEKSVANDAYSLLKDASYVNNPTAQNLLVKIDTNPQYLIDQTRLVQSGNHSELFEFLELI